MSEKIQLLIVDDEIDFLNTIAQRMEMRGFDVTKASNGAEAIEATKTKKYDIALLDLKMPGLNGIEVLEILKKEHKYLEVIILTAHGSIDSAFDTSKLGAFGFLTKPYEFENLIEIIMQAYKKRLLKKFESDKDKYDELLEKAMIPSEITSAESSLDMLMELKKLDNEDK